MSERKINAMIVSSSEKAADHLYNMLYNELHFAIISAASAGDAKRKLISSSIDIVIINTPLKDDFGIQLALDITQNNDVCIALLVKAEYYEQVSYKVEDYGIITIPKPTSRGVILQAMRMLYAMSAKMRTLEQKASSLEMKMEEIRLINRAKLLLIDRLKMTEAQAHRYIEKTAMDSCSKKREIAENIIRIYES